MVARVSVAGRGVAARPATAIPLRLDALRLDPATGAVTALGDLPIADWLELWRAPTDNDRGRAARDEPGQPSYAERWVSPGLDRLVSRLVRLERDADRVTVVTRVGAAGTDAAVDCTWRWTAEPEGLRVALDVVPNDRWPAAWSAHWARVGVSFVLPGTMDRVDWFGRGPGPAYPDSGQAALPGWFSKAVVDLQERTVPPPGIGIPRGGPLGADRLGPRQRRAGE